VCVCSLRYPARNAHAPYCHLWPAPLYHIFPHYLINDTIFEKKLLNTKCVFWFSVQLLSETFFILRRNERDDQNCISVRMYSAGYCCQILMKRDLFSIDLLKTHKMSNFVKIRPVGAELFHADRRMGRHDVANSRFSQFCKRA